MIIHVLACLLLLAPGQHGDHGHDHDDDATVIHSFEGPERWAERFENPERDEWQMPARVVDALVDRPDLVVADIGSATGYFPVRFARAVPEGLVIGSDVEPGMVHYLNDRARREGHGNLVSVLAAPDDPHLPVRADLVFLCNTYHHVDDRVDYLARLADQMTGDARLAVVDYRTDSPRGPDHKLPPEAVKRELAEAGYALVAEHDFLPYQYFLVFRRPPGN